VPAESLYKAKFAQNILNISAVFPENAALSLKSSLKDIATTLKARLDVYRSVYRHPKTPRTAKVLLWLALAYLMSPIDLIPDFIPVIGHLDDLVIVPGLILLALWLIPENVLSECGYNQSSPSE
jgi:uncharacterized membrane protein YkvA (DUF1232 family)